ncbi:hypothetical protein INT44_004644 [Umbelopsis vinacea]|uniref:Uncharacterized protein n=1 Tax=Umbelopsis vinacea TaxID=44442 RepID=A0A8H7UPP1_9FUNG|nr:hypothetical protein INT44_004644 [Umbelopsis vinacea]
MVTAVKPRKSKPLPLVDLFRKTKNESLNQEPSLGSGVQNLPHSSLGMGGFEPYTPNTATLVNSLIRSKSRSRKGQDNDSETLFSPATHKAATPEPAYTTAAAPSRSRSLSRDTRTTARTRSSSRSRSYSVGEQSFIETNPLPPVPSIPPEHQLATKLSKTSINSLSPKSPKYASDIDRRPKYSHEQERNDFTIQHSEPLERSRSKPRAPSRSRTYGSKDTSPLHSRRMRASTSQSSSDEEDNIPLAATNIAPPWLQNRRLSMGAGLHVNLDRSVMHSSLLDDDEEEDDEDHIPIAILSPIRGEFMTAADKYKEKVRERMFKDSSESSDEQEDDNIPIQQIIQQRNQRRRSSSDDSPENERRGRSRNPSRITASEKRARSRAEKNLNIPPVPTLPLIYNI